LIPTNTGPIETEIVQHTIETACDIQQIPSPTFGESQRAAWIAAYFQAESLQSVTIDEVGNVYACLPGAGVARPLVVSAHLDTVFPEGTDLSLSRASETIAGPGIGDNSLGLAGLLGLLWVLRSRRITLPGDLWLVANVCEEGLGDLKGMRAVVDRFADGPSAYLVIEGMGLDQIYHRALGAHRFRISVNTRGGHSWIDYGQPSAIHELVRLATQISSIPIPHDPRTTLNIGVIAGGTSINTIASSASFELDLRSVQADRLEWLSQKVMQAVRQARKPDVQVKVDTIGNRPTGELPIEHPLVQLAINGLREMGHTPRVGIGSTDANLPLSRGYPAVCIGLTSGMGAHSADEFIRLAPLSAGLEQLFRLVTGTYQLKSSMNSIPG
jgi:tripeptide aminopeptidase